MKDFYADFVRRACFRYVQNREEADDLTQDVLLKVACARGRFSGGSRPATWLYRVTTNHCLDHLRRQKRLRGQAERYAARWRVEECARPTWETPEDPDPLENRLGRQVLERLRATSGEVDRQLIYLRFDLDLSQTRIGEVLGMTRAAVSQRLRKIHTRAAHLWWQTA